MRPILQIYNFLIGLVVGSFLNVCIHRIPNNLSLVRPRSSCPNCKAPIRWYHNIPVLSYLLLRGRCANCKTRISPIYPIVELLTGVVFVLLFRKYGWTPLFLIYAILACSLIVLMWIDVLHRLLPDIITLTGIVIGFACSFFNPEVGWKSSLLGILIGGAVPTIVLLAYKWIRKKEGMGHGDIKMLAMIGAFLGWRQVLFVLFASSLLGSIIGLSLMWLTHKDADYEWPFGTYIAIAALVAIFYGGYIWSAYFHLY